MVTWQPDAPQQQQLMAWLQQRLRLPQQAMKFFTQG
jgi:hypothetical protein